MKVKSSIIRMEFFLALALVAGFGITGCNTASDHPPLWVGMTRDDLHFFYGEPIRIVATDAGEDWYYTFVSWTKPEVGGESWHDPVSQSGTVAVNISSTRTREDLPIHVSKDGMVIAPIPPGRIVAR